MHTCAGVLALSRSCACWRVDQWHWNYCVWYAWNVGLSSEIQEQGYKPRILLHFQCCDMWQSWRLVKWYLWNVEETVFRHFCWLSWPCPRIGVLPRVSSWHRRTIRAKSLGFGRFRRQSLVSCFTSAWAEHGDCCPFRPTIALDCHPLTLPMALDCHLFQPTIALDCHPLTFSNGAGLLHIPTGDWAGLEPTLTLTKSHYKAVGYSQAFTWIQCKNCGLLAYIRRRKTKLWLQKLDYLAVVLGLYTLDCILKMPCLLNKKTKYDKVTNSPFSPEYS